MRGRLFAIAAAAALCTSCALPIAPAPSALDRIERGYQRLSASAELVLPLLPADREVRVRALLASIGLAIGAVRAATSDGDRAAVIAQLDAQVAALGRALRR